MLRFLGVGVVEFDSEVGNIVVHGEADCVIGVYWSVVPLQVDDGLKVAFPVYSYFIVFSRTDLRWRACRSPTYSMLKSSTSKQNIIGCQVWRQRTGVMGQY